MWSTIRLYISSSYVSLKTADISSNTYSATYCFQSSDKLETNIAKGLIISVKLTGILLIAFFVFCLQAFISEFSKERPCVLTRSYLQVNSLINNLFCEKAQFFIMIIILFFEYYCTSSRFSLYMNCFLVHFSAKLATLISWSSRPSISDFSGNVEAKQFLPFLLLGNKIGGGNICFSCVWSGRLLRQRECCHAVFPRSTMP